MVKLPLGLRRVEAGAKAAIRKRNRTCRSTQGPLKPHQSDTDKRAECKGNVKPKGHHQMVHKLFPLFNQAEKWRENHHSWGKTMGDMV